MYTKNFFWKNIVTPLLVVGVVLMSGLSSLANVAHAQVGYSECDDTIDNDNDGNIDMNDTDCIGTYGYGSETTYTAPPPVQSTTAQPNIISLSKHTYRTPGAYIIAVPKEKYEMRVKVWGAGGGGGTGQKTPNHNVAGYGGGGGGYAEEVVAVTPGTNVRIVVGKGGLYGEGGQNSEVSVDQVAIAGAGGGGGGLSVGGPGYSTGGSGFFSILAKIVLVAVVTYFSAGALSGIAGSIGGATTAAGGAVGSTLGITTGYVSTGVVAAGAGEMVAGTLVLPTFTVTATAVTTGTTVGAGALATGVTAGAVLSTAPGNSTLSSGIGAVGATSLAQDISSRDPRVAGGVDGLAGLGFGGIRGSIGAGRGGTWNSESTGGGGGCFTPDTLITMADGSVKEVSRLVAGDIVRGETMDNQVLDVKKVLLGERSLYSINGSESFVTAGHPFKTTEGWKSIDPTETIKEGVDISVTKLSLGDMVLTENGSEVVTSITAHADDASRTLYNPVLDGDHTYYANGFLVHNKLQTLETQLLNLLPTPAQVLGAITFAKQALAQAWRPVYGTGGSGYAGATKATGDNGGPYAYDGSNPDSSSGGAGANGGAGGHRGRLGRDGTGHCNGFTELETGGAINIPCSSPDARAKDGGFPGGGGGGSDTGTGGYGADGQVILEFADGGVPPNSPVPQCRDGIDNDGDTLVDYLNDPGCADINDNDEFNEGSQVSTPNNAPSALSLTCPAGSLKAGEVGNFSATGTDTDAGDALSYVFTWGDGGTTSAGPASSGQAVSATKSWATQGQKKVDVSVTDKQGASKTNSCSVNISGTVNNPSVSIGASPANVIYGGSTTLSWSSLNVSSCTASDGWSGSKALSGTQSVGPLLSNTTFTLTCTGTNGSVNGSVTVTVGAPPAQCADGIDNDSDGKVDMSDPGCTSVSDNDETDSTSPPPPTSDYCPNIIGVQSAVPLGYIVNTSGDCVPNPGPDWCPNISGVQLGVPSGMTVNNLGQCVVFTPECSDGIDNDGDGRTDFPADLGCANGADNSENSENPPCTINCGPGDGGVGNGGNGGNGGGNNGGSGGNVSGFTVSGTPKIAIQFLAGLEGMSQVANVSVNPTSGFSSPVTLTVEDIRTINGVSLPSGVTPTYYFSGNATPSILMSYDPSLGQYTNPSGTIGTTFAVKLSKKITEKYYITLVGTSGSQRATFVIELNPNAINPDFREI